MAWDYEKQKEYARQRNKEQSESGRDIAPLPAVVNPERREACGKSLRLFCETYFPETFYLAWSPDQLKVIDRIETAVRDGGLFAMAMPRGSGKTTISNIGAMWGGLYGWRKFVVLVGASEDAAREMLESIKDKVETNDLLLEDFPEVCYPVRRLEGITARIKGQLCEGERTDMEWGETLRLAKIAGSAASGVIIKAVGITGRIRGMKVGDLRPDMVIIDDPQTDESAGSPEQNNKRLRLLNGAILGLAGPGKKISGVMPCTVIRPDDMADRILDRGKNPEWNGERCRLLLSFPTDMDLWNKYREVSVDSYRMHGDNRDGRKFYEANRTAMDAGAVSSWPERHEPDEVSGIQYAMNIYYRNRSAFFAEYQNQPEAETDAETDVLELSDILSRTTNRPRGIVPASATMLTLFIDVQKDLLYFVVMAWSDGFSGSVVDYGAYPDQKRRYFSLNEAHPTYGDLFPGAGLEGAVYGALRQFTGLMLTKDWPTETGETMRISFGMVDSGWGRSTEAVYRACRESEYSAILLPSKGDGITAAQKPITEYDRRRCRKLGLHWYIPSNGRSSHRGQLLIYDANFWKSFIRQRILTAAGDKGDFTLFKGDEEDHRMLAEQMTSETATPTAGRGRRVDVWTMLPGRENHLLDCVVGCYVGASFRGEELMGSGGQAPRSAAPKRSERRTFGAGRVFRPH